MLTFDLGKLRLELSFGFFAIIAFASLTGSEGAGASLVSLLCCVLHECGHLAAMAAFHVRPEAICFYGGGIKLKTGALRISAPKEACVLAAGCAVNAVLFAVCLLIGCAKTSFAAANILLCGFNLMPFEGLDGDRLARLLTDGEPRWYNVLVLARTAAVGLMLAVTVRLAVSGSIGFTAAAAMIYVTAGGLIDRICAK